MRITPAAATTQRVFVGRMEVITPTTLRVVRTALSTNDTATLAAYSRFLSPITQRIVQQGVDATTANQLRATGLAAFTSYVNREKRCR